MKSLVTALVVLVLEAGFVLGIATLPTSAPPPAVASLAGPAGAAPPVVASR